MGEVPFYRKGAENAKEKIISEMRCAPGSIKIYRAVYVEDVGTAIGRHRPLDGKTLADGKTDGGTPAFFGFGNIELNPPAGAAEGFLFFARLGFEYKHLPVLDETGD